MDHTTYFSDDMLEMVDLHNNIVELLEDESLREQCKLSYTDSYPVAKKKCAKSYAHGAYFLPLVTRVLSLDPDNDDDTDSDGGDGGVGEVIAEEKSSTPRVRKYYKKHPEKVKKYLRKTSKDRAARNRDRAKAVEKHGEKKMANHDVHHPNGPDGGSWQLAKKDHGPDKKADKKKKSAPKKAAPKKEPPKKSAPKKAAPKKEPTKKAPPKKQAPNTTEPPKKAAPKKHPHLSKTLQNPKTARDVLLATALSYPPNHPLYKAAVEFIRALMMAYPEDHPMFKAAQKLKSQD